MLPKKPSLSLDAPSGDVVLLTEELIQNVLQASRISPRRRMILPLHKSADAPLHRMFNALQPGTYIRPHRHHEPPKAESIVLLRGRIVYFTFKESGEITATHLLRAGGAAFGIDTEPGVFHTFLAADADTLLFEVKPGPYHRATDKDFAAWAPAEDDSAAASKYLKHLEQVAGLT
jgi:cupin fold WbuC family metalloprotein